MSSWLRLERVRGSIEEARPDLAHLVSTDTVRMITIDLPCTRFDDRPRVVVGDVTAAYWPYVLVTGLSGMTFLYSSWPVSAECSDVAAAAWIMYESCSHGDGALPSPWRWSETEPSAIVEVADVLTAAGIEVTAVADSNRLIPDRLEGHRDVRPLPEHFGPALRAECDWGTLMLSRRHTLGWVLDGNDGLDSRRLPLAHHMGRTGHQFPGVDEATPQQLADGVRAAVKAGPWDSLGNRFAFADFPGDVPVHEHVAWWMRELGHPHAHAYGYAQPVVEAPVHVSISVRGRQLSLPEVKAAFADAALASKPLFLFARAGFSSAVQPSNGRIGQALPCSSWPGTTAGCTRTA
jgi:hypothetical protein